MLNLASIRSVCSSQSYTRGRALWLQGAVDRCQIEDIGADIDEVQATVYGSLHDLYEVYVDINRANDEIDDYSCTCPAHRKYSEMCKHCVAASFEYLSMRGGTTRDMKVEQAANRLQEILDNRAGGDVGTTAGGEAGTAARGDAGMALGADASAAAKGEANTSSAAEKSQPSGEPEQPAPVPVKRSMQQGGSQTSAGYGSSYDAHRQTPAQEIIRSYREAQREERGGEEHPGFIGTCAFGSVRIEPLLTYERYHGWYLTFRIGTDARLYVVKHVSDFVNDLAEQRTVVYGKSLTLKHDRRVFTPQANKLIDFILRAAAAWRVKQSERYSFYSYQDLRNKMLYLTDESLVEYFELNAGSKVMCDLHTAARGVLAIVAGNPALHATLGKDMSRCYEFICDEEFQCLKAGEKLCLRLNGTVYCCDKEFSKEMAPFCSTIGNPFGAYKSSAVCGLEIKREDMPGFIAAVLSILEKHMEIRVVCDLSSFKVPPLRFAFKLDRFNGMVTCTVEAIYGDATNFTSVNPLSDKSYPALIRDLDAEAALLSVLYGYFAYNLSDGSGVCFPESDDDALYALLTEGVATIAQKGELLASEAFKRLTVRQAPQVTVGVSLGSDLLNLEIQSSDLSFSELRAYLDSFSRKRRFFRLDNGDIIALQETGNQVFSDLVETLDLDLTDAVDGVLQLPKYRALYLDAAIDEHSEGDCTLLRDSSFDALIAQFNTIETSSFVPPAEIGALLRPYQLTGFKWLKTLESVGFCGILADEMGLGKTIQAIAFLASYYEKLAGAAGAAEHLPSLVISPASLVYNWVEEFAKFAPQLDVVAIVGDKVERTKLVGECTSHDVIVTSYDLLKRDLDVYRSKRFFCEIIDEAQYIKNQTTQSARSVKSIKAVTRLALTGTPIENRLSELWSIFDFLMPGLLGKYKVFKERFESPIVLNKDEAVTMRLQRMIKPFVLRRLKRDVLRDLPDKSEDIVLAQMEPEQAKLYQTTALQLKLTLEKQLPQEFRTGKIAILAEIMKLRQLCCDPHLLYDNYYGGSAKLDICLELIGNAIDGGHKILVFSQFTSMLAIIEERLRQKKVAYHLLTGATSKEARAQLVKSFSVDEVPVFLISLKAGGTGLNLTAADIVIHYDPWWNLAAQNQATDRTHRIGQDKVVTVFKLIAKGTIEESIVKMQETKRDLAEKIISGEGVSVSDLTKEDFLALLD